MLATARFVSSSSSRGSATAAKAILGMLSTAGVYIAYDYCTCHPMRKLLGYDPKTAYIRFHNTFRPAWTYLSLDLKQLSEYNGTCGKQTYFASNGLIWDVSQHPSFDQAYKFWKGKDATMALATMTPHDINRMDWDSLTEKELESLQSWTRYYQEKYFIQGRLQEFETFLKQRQQQKQKLQEDSSPWPKISIRRLRN